MSSGASEVGRAVAEDTARVLAPPPLIYGGALAVGFGIDVVLGSPHVAGGLRWGAGGTLVVAGTGLMGAFVSAFRQARTAVDPYRPTTAIVTTGPYRLTRNPGYVGMALLYGGIALTSGALWALLPLPVAMLAIDRGVIAREERYLERKFGSEYVAYKQRVRRWL